MDGAGGKLLMFDSRFSSAQFHNGTLMAHLQEIQQEIHKESLL